MKLGEDKNGEEPPREREDVALSPEAGIEPGSPTRQSNAQPAVPIGLSPIGRAVTVGLWLGCYTYIHF